jgi:hypothetical protein
MSGESAIDGAARATARVAPTRKLPVVPVGAIVFEKWNLCEVSNAPLAKMV